MAKRRAASAKPAAMTKPVNVGTAWYTEEEWLLVKGAATDPERFEETYREWLAMAEDAIQDLLARGVVAERIKVSCEALRAWCLVRGKKNNAQARAQFVSEVMPKQDAGHAKPFIQAEIQELAALN